MLVGDLRESLKDYPDDYEFGLVDYVFNPNQQKSYIRLEHPFGLISNDEHRIACLFFGSSKDTSMETVCDAFDQFLYKKNEA